jgi:hypothetical protein
MGFGLDDWIYCTLYIHTVWNYRQYSAIAILHTFKFTIPHSLGFSVFTSRILATDLSQSHCNCKSHMKSSLHRIIPFLSLFCNCQLNSIPSSAPGRLASRTRLSTRLLFSSALCCRTLLYNHFARIEQKTQPLLLRRRVDCYVV